MNVDLLTIAGVLAALAVVPWIHIGQGGRDDGWAPRFTAWMLALSAAAFTLAVPQWRDTLAAFTAGKGGLGVLTVVLFVSGLCFWLQAVHRRKESGGGGGWRSWFKKKGAAAPALKPRHARHHYHRVYTMVISAGFGTATVLAWVRGKQLIAEIAKSPARAQVALGQYSQAVHNGSAVHALTPAQQHHYELIAGAIFVVGCLLFRGHERRRHGKPFLLPGKKPAKAAKGGGGGGGQPAVGGGRAALPPGMGR